ncbi:tumor necrosis factor receptor superfamily member 6 isoform X1 [Cynoglossus semilaevis]|nr:tumor necrosis factor receptor superfamily member 6 isoform X1 [Cynoglossus semilaevis]
MASHSNTLTFYLFFVLFCDVSQVYSSTSFPDGTRVTWHSVKGLFRHRRQLCQDGTYDHEGNTCCLCSAGQRVETHCTKSNEGKCELCEGGTYSNAPNSQQTCEPCRSCDHPNANQEVEETCTPARNTKCRCKKGHFCSDNIERCKICHPCQECGAEGVQVPCTATNDTICYQRSEGGNGVAIAVTIIILVLLGFVAAAVCWKKKILCFKRQVTAQENGSAGEHELHLLRDIEPHLTELAGILGWKDMRTVAIRSGMSATVVDNCEQSHPGDKEEQTFLLLRKFVEKEGRAASENLIRILRQKGKKDKAEKVSRLLNDANAVASAPAV